MKKISALVLLVVPTVVVAMHVRGERPASARERAVAAFEQAERAATTGQLGSQLDLLLETLRIDPTYTAAIAELWLHPAVRFYSPHVEARVQATITAAGDTAVARCVHNILELARERQVRVVVDHRSIDCDKLFAAVTAVRFGADKPADSYAIALWRKYPESAALASFAKDEFVFRGDTADAREAALEMLRQTPRVRAIGFALLHDVERRSDQPAAADSIVDAALRSLAGSPQAILGFASNVAPRMTMPLDSVLQRVDRWGRLGTLVRLATEAYANGYLVESEQRWRFLEREYGDIRAVVTDARHHLGRTYMKAGRLDEAEVLLLQVRELVRVDATPSTAIQAEHNLFHVYEGMGDRDRALAAGTRYIEAALPWQFMSQRMMAYHDIGWYHWQLGDYQQARVLLERMLSLIDTLGDYRHFAGEYYERTGQLDRALQFYNRAAALEKNDYRSIARRATIAAQMGNEAEALRLAAIHDNTLGPGYPEFTPQLPTILQRFGRYEEALRIAETAFTRARERRQAAAVANLLLQRATLELQLGRDARARLLADSAVQHARTVGAFDTEMLARATGARARHSSAELSALAAQASKASLPALELQLRTMLGDALAEAGRYRDALSAYRAAADLNDRIAASLASDADRARFRSASNDVSGKALSLIIRTRAARSADDFAEWSVRRKAQGIRGANATRMRPPRPISGAAIVDYVVLDSIVAALVVTRGRSSIAVLPVAPADLARDVQRFQDELAPRIGGSVDVGRAHFDIRRAHSFYRTLVEPLLGALDGAEHLTIVADGPLHYLPFDAIVTAVVNGKPRYLVERLSIQHALSLAPASVRRDFRKQTVLAFAGGAAAAEEEVLAIANHASAGMRVMPVLASAATEQRVRGFVEDAGIVHFATHASPNDASPLFAYLGLTADDDDDGRLHAFEIEKLELASALVVLSGCDTGRGYLAGGEGVLSLSRAFLRAGASATVATLWAVGRGSPELMAEFYRELSAGSDPTNALRNAKLLALQGRYAHPLYWAAFVLVAA